METQQGAEAAQTQAPGTLEKFHLGLAADGTSCAMVFVDEQHRSIACIASFADLDGFIVSLTRAAAEMSRRRAGQLQDREAAGEEAGVAALPPDAMVVASSEFQRAGADGSLLGALVGQDGQVLPLQMSAAVANEMTRNILRAAPVASSC